MTNSRILSISLSRGAAAAMTAALIIFGGAAGAAKSNAAHSTSAKPGSTAAQRMSFPSVEAGLRYLQLAEASLAKGYHSYSDFGGHRQKAQDLTQQAIAETQKALQFRTH